MCIQNTKIQALIPHCGKGYMNFSLTIISMALFYKALISHIIPSVFHQGFLGLPLRLMRKDHKTNVYTKITLTGNAIVL